MRITCGKQYHSLVYFQFGVKLDSISGTGTGSCRVVEFRKHLHRVFQSPHWLLQF